MARVLHIEDDPQNRLLVKKLLAAEDHEVIEAADGLAGVEAARTSKPDIVLVDIQIPGLDGYEVILRLRSLPGFERLPIVAITAEGDRTGSLAVGATGFLQKPIDAKTFARTIKRFLEGQREKLTESEAPLRERSFRMAERLEDSVRDLTYANARLEEMARLRREYIQNVSHELSTPMTPVIGYVQMLLDGSLGPLTKEQKKALAAVERAMARLRAVASNLIDVSALETGRLAFEFRPYDFVKLATRAVKSVQADFNDRGITLTVEPRAEGVEGTGDADKLERAMVHVLDNASKFTPKGGEVAAAVRVKEETVSFIVTDSGPGIADAARERILETFYQADGSATRAFGGVGLGLAFARQVCEKHGGKVRVMSPPKEEIAGVILNGAQIELRVQLRPKRDEP